MNEELYKNISEDYEFDVVQALVNKRYNDVAKHLPIFIYDVLNNLTYTLTDIKTITSVTDVQPKTYLEVNYWGVIGQEEDFYGFGPEPDDTSYHNVYGLVKKDLLVEKDALNYFVPAFKMTEKQRAYLLKTYSEDHLNYMSGKEAWTLIDGIIRKAKKEQQSRFKQRSSYRNYDPDYEDWGYEEPYPGFEMDYCGGGR